ncbi:response regulator [Roseibacillus ishigakijimensis]|uniref:Response regulator transcription factor n=1 Tax=Roseibacillus ishigakijimensis TaxID=454146 RepID=A0A934RP69_9BACT|nr:response regulator transcription factor [Roseibacillus ishigakijimensis]MBK1833277.1 response regulator transcription factor [Roseibacillus ishigakijimensis]
MPPAIRVQIIEDNARYRSSLQHMVRLTEGLTLAASFSCAEDYLTTTPPPGADLTLLDLHLPDRDGLQLIPPLLKQHPKGNILVLTQNADHRTTLEAIRLGVSGYLLKDTPIASIREALFEIQQGACLIDPQLSRIVLQALTGRGRPGGDRLLSQREEEILRLLSLGYLKKEIAEQLHISYRTVAQHTENIYRKLQVPNVAAAVAAAIRKGLI